MEALKTVIVAVSSLSVAAIIAMNALLTFFTEGNFDHDEIKAHIREVGPEIFWSQILQLGRNGDASLIPREQWPEILKALSPLSVSGGKESVCAVLMKRYLEVAGICVEESKSPPDFSGEVEVREVFKGIYTYFDPG